MTVVKCNFYWMHIINSGNKGSPSLCFTKLVIILVDSVVYNIKLDKKKELWCGPKP